MSKIAFLNSNFIKFKNAKIHIEDRGLQFSDSVYEVVSVYKKRLIDFEFHIKRLKYSLKELEIKYKIDSKNLEKIFLKLINLNNIINGIIYLQITRGNQPRNHSYNLNYKPNIIIYCRKKIFNIPNNNFKGYKAITAEDLRWKRRDIKSVSLLANILAKQIAEKQGAHEAILIDNNIVTEGTSSNVWIVKKKVLITHPSNNNILKGVTRDSIKMLIRDKNIKFREKTFKKRDLYKSDEVFITSSTNFVTPITNIDNIKISDGKIGPITRHLANLYFKVLNDE